MKTKFIWIFLMIGLGMSSFLAQEKQPSKAGQSAGTASPAETAAVIPPVNVPHTYQITPEQSARKNPVRFTDLSAEMGRKIFVTQCVMCHGPKADGKGDLAVDIKLHPPDFNKPDVLGKRTDGDLFVIISGGSDVMPGQSDRMAEQQRWEIINYLRTVEGKVPAKATQAEREQEGTVIVPASH